MCRVWLTTGTIMAVCLAALPRAEAFDELVFPRSIEVREVTPTELQKFERSGNYVHVESDVLKQLLMRRAAAVFNGESQVRRAECSAEFDGRAFRNGTLELFLEESGDQLRREVSLGQTNLNDLRLYSQGIPLTMATDSAGNTVPLIPPESETITGTWEATGRPAGKAIVFQLKLPDAAVALFRLSTDTVTIVSSRNALVVPGPKSKTRAEWLIYPRDPSELEISCTTRDDAGSRGDVSLTIAASARADLKTATMTWETRLPVALRQSRLAFRLSQPCSVKSVSSSDTPVVDWSVDPGSTTLFVELPDITAAATIRIEAVIDRTKEDELTVPFLVPESWKSNFGETGGNLQLRSGTLQLIVSPEVLVTDLQLDGLLERDIAYSREGVQTLELSQFSREATATVFLTQAIPVVDDSVVIKVGTGADSGQATAFIYVTARTGTVGRVHWALPRTWRVTDLREIVSGLPLLFRVKDPVRPGGAAEVDVFLRAPVGGESGQGLVAKLQSTERGVAVTGEMPRLTNPQYNRRTDLLAFDTADIPAAFSVSSGGYETGGRSAENVLTQESWLPEDQLDSVVFFERSNRVGVSEQDDLPQEQLYATIDYAVEESGNVVRENLRLRIRSSNELPARIVLHVTPEIALRVSEDSVTQPLPALTRQLAGTSFDTWILEPAAGETPPGEYDVMLESIRPLADRMPASMVTVADARQTGGTVQPPAEATRLILTRELPLTQVEQYPVMPFEDDWTLLRSRTSASHLNVSGTAFIMLNAVGDAMTADVQQRIVVNADGNQTEIRAEFPPAVIPAVSVDGRPVFPDRRGRHLIVPLSSASAQSEVTAVFTVPVDRSAEDLLTVPLLIFPDADSVNLASFLLPSADCRLDADNGMIVRPAEEVTDMLSAENLRSSLPATPDPATAFHARWRLRTLDSSRVYCTNLTGDTAGVEFRSERSTFDTSRNILWALLFLMFWILLETATGIPVAVPAGVLVVASLLTLTSDLVSESFVNGLLIGTILFCVAHLSGFRRALLRENSPRDSSSLLLRISVLLSAFLISSLGFAYDEASRPSVLIPAARDGKIPFACVEKEYLARLRAVESAVDSEVLVITSAIRVTMESPQSFYVSIQCLVASEPDRERTMTLPLDGVSLVECALDNRSVFPVRGPSGKSEIKIPSIGMVPYQMLDDRNTSAFSSGPDTLGRWNLHTVEYSVRGVPQRSPRDYRISLPYPPSAETRISFNDTSQLIEQASLPSSLNSVPLKIADNGVRFPTIFNGRSFELSLLPGKLPPTVGSRSQRSSMLCLADVSPAQHRLTCEYRVVPPDPGFRKVIVGADPRYRISSVTTKDGEPVVWSLDGGHLIAEVTPDERGVQHFVVRQLFEPLTSFSHEIPVGAFSRVNGQSTDSSFLLPATTSQFVISSVKSDGTVLEKPLRLEEVGELSNGRGSDGILKIPTASASVVVELARLQETRIARLAQTALVSDESIEWTCRAEIDITGQPSFRQSLRVSPDVRITRVSARSEGVSIMQTWTRHDDRVVVSLREATRGLLELELVGTLPRPPDQDTALPVVQLPTAIQVTESDLQLSADAEMDTYIETLGSAVPEELFDIAVTPVPTAPVRMSLLDKAQPIVVRGSSQKLIKADLVVLLYDVAGKNRSAQFLNLRTPNVAFDIRFRCPAGDFGSTRPFLIRDGEIFSVTSDGDDYVIPRQTQVGNLSQLVLVLPDIPATMIAGEVSCRIPGFDSEVEVSSFQAFESRDTTGDRGKSLAVALPDWAAAAASSVEIATDMAGADLAESRFDTAAQSIVIRPEMAAAAPVATSDTPGALLVESMHLLRFGNDGGVAGNSDFIVFRSQPGTPLLVSLPDSILVVDIQLNGRSQGFSVNDGVASLTSDERVTSVAVVWFHHAPQQLGHMDHQIALPDMAAGDSHSQAIIVPAPQRTHLWSLANEQVSANESRAVRRDALSRGLRLLGVEATPPESGRPGDDEDSQYLWQLMANESPDATRTATSFFADIDRRIGENTQIVRLDENRTISYSSLRMPPLLPTLSILTGLVFMAAPVFSRSAQRHHGTVPTESTSATRLETADSSNAG